MKTNRVIKNIIIHALKKNFFLLIPEYQLSILSFNLSIRFLSVPNFILSISIHGVCFIIIVREEIPQSQILHNSDIQFLL